MVLIRQLNKILNIEDSGYWIDWQKLMRFSALMFVHTPLCLITITLFYLPLKESNQTQIDALSDLEIIEHWRKLFKGPDIIQRYLKGESLSKEQYMIISETVDKWRQRLADISWYMRCLNKYNARKANIEYHCKGRLYSPPSMALTCGPAKAVQFISIKISRRRAIQPSQVLADQSAATKLRDD